MKKKISVLLTLVLLLSLFTSVFAAENNGIMLNYDLTYNGEHSATVDSGTVITVTYYLENVTADEDYTISSHTNEIYFDHEFFEYMGDDEIEKSDCIGTAKKNVYSWGENRVYFNGSHLNEKFYSSKNFMGTFKLKVKATSGSSTISSKEITAFDNDGKRYTVTTQDLTIFVGNAPEELYTVTYMNDETVYKTIETTGIHEILSSPSVPIGYMFKGWKNGDKLYQPGDEFNVTEDVTFTAVWEKIVEAKKYTLTFDANGGGSINAVTEKENTVIDLSKYTTTKAGYTFKGWYSDVSLTHKVTEITLDGDKTVYAKWSKNSSGNTGGGSGTVTQYTLMFETNGGSEIKSVSKVKNTTVDLSKYITSKEGYSFDGWYTDKELTKKVTEIKMTGDITLYAKWVEGDNGYKPNPNYKPDIFSSDHYSYIVGRDGGYIQPNANLTRAEAAEMFYRLLNSEVRTESYAAENKFSDVNSDDWFNVSVSTLANIGVINGRTADTFAPNAEITRAELTTLIARLSEATYDGEDLFSDISGHWAKDYINLTASIKWVNGENGKFRPDDSITRAEVITLINRALNRMPESKADLIDAMVTPLDNTDQNAWYYIAIQEAVNSHTYEMKSDGVHEKWTSLTENPDWANLND